MSDPAGVVGNVSGATDDGEFTNGVVVLTFAVGETEKVVSLEAPENDHYCRWRCHRDVLGSMCPGRELADPSSVTLTVEDNDVAAFTVTPTADGYGRGRSRAYR